MKFVRVLKKIGKALLITLLVVILLVVVLLTTAKIFENKITHFALNKVSEMIKAPVKCDTVSLLLLRKFPHATVEFKGFKLGATTDTVNFGRQQQLYDTLFSFDRVYVAVKTMPLLKSHFEVKQVEIAGINLNYAVDSAGVSNFDFLLKSDTSAVEEPQIDDTTAMVLNVLLKDLTLRNIALCYQDDKMNLGAHALIPKLHLEGKIQDDYYAGLLEGQVLVNRCRFEGFNLDLMHETSLNFDLNYDDGNAHIKRLQLLSDGLDFLLKGNATLADSIFMDLKLKLNTLNFKEIAKYLPQKMLDEFGVQDLAGNLNLKADVNGYFYDTLLLPAVDASIRLKDCRVITAAFPAVEHLGFNIDVNAPNLHKINTLSANVRSLQVKTPKSSVELKAQVSSIEHPVYDMNAALLVDLDEVAGFIPQGTVQELSGMIKAKIATKGQLPKVLGIKSADYFLDRTSIDLSLVDIDAALDSANQFNNVFIDLAYRPNRTFSISNLSADAPGLGVSLGKSLLKGSVLGRLSDMEHMGAKVDSFYFVAGQTNIGGTAYLKGLKKPDFRIDTRLNVVIDDMIRSFIPDSLVDAIAGKISVHLQSQGQLDLDSISTQIMPIAFEQSRINLGLRDLKVDMFDDTLVKVDDLALDLELAHDTIKIDKLHARAHGIDLWIDSTEVMNAYKAFLLKQPDKRVIAQLNLRLGDLDYATFAPLLATDTTAGKATSETSQQPVDQPVAATEATTAPADTATPMFIPHFLARGSIGINSARYMNNFVDNIGLKFRLEDSLYVIDDFTLHSFGGNIVTSLVLDTRPDTLTIIEFHNQITNLDIHQVLKDNDDFGMSQTISHENISGILTSEISGKVLMDTAIIMDRLNVLGDFQLADGGVYNFEPIMAIGKFTGMKELENITFKTLRTNLFILNNKIFIPKTDIVSTALDVTAYGMKSFGPDYEYHAVVHLGDVLFGKSSKLMKQQGLEGDIANADDKTVDRKGLYLIVAKNQGLNKTGFDNKKLQRKMQNTIKVQHAILGMMFHPRMVNFSTEFDRSKNVKKKGKPEQNNEPEHRPNAEAVKTDSTSSPHHEHDE